MSLSQELIDSLNNTSIDDILADIEFAEEVGNDEFLNDDMFFSVEGEQ